MTNGEWVRWSMWTDSGMTQFGQMPVTKVAKNIRDFEREAKKTLDITGADHVLYAVKVYDDQDHLREVKFYMKPMSDEEFYDVVARIKGIVVYALHRRK